MYKEDEMTYSIAKWFGGGKIDSYLGAAVKDDLACAVLKNAKEEWTQQDDDWDRCIKVAKNAAKQICNILNSELTTEWVITLETDPFNASKWRGYERKKILKRDGATPVKWIMDDNWGIGYTAGMAHRALYTLWCDCSDCENCDKSYRFFSNRFDYDVYIYRMERVSDLFIAER